MEEIVIGVFDKMLENLQDEQFIKEVREKLNAETLKESNFKPIDELEFLNELDFDGINDIFKSLKEEENDK